MKTEAYKAGDLDLKYGNNGVVIFPQALILFGMAVDENENTYVAGRSLDEKFYVARVTRDGKLDTAFGGVGYVIGVFLDDHKSQAFTVTVDQQNRVLITGNLMGWGDRICVARFMPDGSFDETFADKGRGAIPPPADGPTSKGSESVQASSQPNGVTVLSDGKIVIFWNYFQFIPYLIRLTKDGVLDPTFNDGGYVKVSYKEHDLYPSAMTVLKGERLIIGAFENIYPVHYGLLIGYDLNGRLDSNFAEGGYRRLEEPADVGSEVWNLQQVQGEHIWAIGRTTAGSMGSEMPPSRGFLTKLNKEGHIDTTFNLGKPVLTSGDYPEEWIAGAVQNDGKIVLAGSQHHGRGGMLGRYNADGTLDTAFGENGISFFPNGSDARLVMLQQDGSILAGGAVLQSGYRVAVLLRYHK